VKSKSSETSSWPNPNAVQDSRSYQNREEHKQAKKDYSKTALVLFWAIMLASILFSLIPFFAK
jgi:hypothetical protein